MSRGRKVFVAVCAAIVALAVTSALLWLVRDWVFQHGIALSVVAILAPYAVFGLVAAGLYTCVVDGSLRPGRPRRRP